MNYEKKYKEALERARVSRLQLIDIGEEATEIEHIFPELKESEDERIRKEIMDFIDTNTIDSDERRDRWFSYLEKHKPISFTSLEDRKVKTSLMQYISELNQDVVHLHPGIKTCNEWIAWLDKQGEKESVTCPICGWEIEKQCEQNSTDEPKFKVGDWIVFNGLILHIDEIVDGYYRTTSIGGIPNSYDWAIDNAARLWVIQDAKGGDVLATDNGNIFVFDGAAKDGRYPFAYCGLIRHRFEIYDRRLPFTNNNIYPATKEQCDLLFQKMHEAGYTFDFDKKELKKMEQKSADKAEPKFKVGDILVSDEEDRRHIYKVDAITNYDTYLLLDLEDGYTRNEPTYTSDLAMYLWTIQDAKDGDVLAIDPWSDFPSSFVAIYKKQNEEDFDTFDSYCFVGFDGKFYEGEYGHSSEDIHPATKEQRDLLFQKMKEEGYEWDAEKPDSLPKDNWELVHEFVEKFGRIPKDEDELNVLVEYVFKRQKTAWSEEDEKMFRSLHNLIYVVRDCDCDSNEKKELSDWIESLKGRVQPQYEWSEEEIEKAAQEWDSKANFNPFYMSPTGVKQDITTHKESFKAGINWFLKSLKGRVQPQNTWKPSDEQMEVLEALVEDNNQRYFYPILNSLYEHLKKLRE